MVDLKMFWVKVLKIFLKFYLLIYWGCLKDSFWGIFYIYGREIVGGKLVFLFSILLNLNMFNDYLFNFYRCFCIIFGVL